ncbi:MAG: hypothetical protein ACUVUU_04735 [bacterium]
MRIRSKPFPHFYLLIIATAVLFPQAPFAYEDENDLRTIPVEEIFAPESSVKDPFYRYLIGLIEADICGTVNSKTLSSALSKHKSKTDIPFQLIDRISRSCESLTNPCEVSISFKSDLKASIPYSILGYHPGSVRASEVVDFIEWRMPRKTIQIADGRRIDLTDVHLFAPQRGWAMIDMDAWIEKLTLGLIDDTRIVGLGLFRYQGEWYGLATGYDPQGNGRSGIFSFSANKILFPTPEHFQGVGPHFRNYIINVKRVEPPLPPIGNWKR